MLLISASITFAMNGTWWIITCLICLLIVGYLKVRFLISILYKDKIYTLEYRRLFNQFAITFFENYTPLHNKVGNFNPELYDWLMSRSNKMQIKLGGFGIVHYTAPFNKFVFPSYRVLLNTLPKFRDRTILPEEVNSVDNALISYDGFLDTLIEQASKELINPLIWFRNGVQLLLSFPLRILSWFGLLKNKSLNSILDSSLFKIISGFFSFVGFLSSIVTIALGYDQTLELIKKYIHKN